MTSPIEPPPRSVEALDAWHAAISARIALLFNKYRLEQSSFPSLGGTWRSLTIRLAIEHDPDFRIAIILDELKLPTQKALDRISRHHMMDDIINYEPKLNRETGQYDDIKRAHPLPVKEAAVLVRRMLVAKGLDSLANEASSIATSYSRDRHLFKNAFSEEMLHPYREYFRTIAGIQYVASGASVEELHAALQSSEESINVCASSALAARIGLRQL